MKFYPNLYSNKSQNGIELFQDTWKLLFKIFEGYKCSNMGIQFASMGKQLWYITIVQLYMVSFLGLLLCDGNSIMHNQIAICVKLLYKAICHQIFIIIWHLTINGGKAGFSSMWNALNRDNLVTKMFNIYFKHCMVDLTNYFFFCELGISFSRKLMTNWILKFILREQPLSIVFSYAQMLY